ncbi:MAG: hypothetical protein WC848_03590 [Parcubacteria group bacterium]
MATPLALLTRDELGYYLGLNPQKLTALKLLGEDTAENIGTFFEAFVKGNAVIIQMPGKEERELLSDLQFHPASDHRLERKDLAFFDVMPEGIFLTKQSSAVFTLICEAGRMFWKRVDGGEDNVEEITESVVFLCKPAKSASVQ